MQFNSVVFKAGHIVYFSFCLVFPSFSVNRLAN